MTCPSVETLSDLLDNALPSMARWQVKRHTRHCPSCTRQLAAEARLRERALSVAAEATAPASLRFRVYGIVTVAPPRILGPRRSAPILLAAALCSVLAALTVWLLRPVVVPLPAFARVVEAMRTVRTAQWREEFSTYDVATKKANRFVVMHSARLDPPALSTAYPPEPRRTLLTPANLKVEESAGFRIFSAPGFAATVEKSAPATPSSVLREHILRRISAPRSPGGGSAAWKSRREIVDGRELLRFESKMGGRPLKGKALSGTETSRLTVPGYRYRIWADPDTLRVVKSETEYYDGQNHSRTACTNFRYDLPLPESEFQGR